MMDPGFLCCNNPSSSKRTNNWEEMAFHLNMYYFHDFLMNIYCGKKHGHYFLGNLRNSTVDIYYFI
jgi:hypothetical protein